MGNESLEVLSQLVKNRIQFFENLGKNPLEHLPNGNNGNPCFILPQLEFLNVNGQPISVEKDVECFSYDESPTSRMDSWRKLKKTKSKCSDNLMLLLNDTQCTKVLRNQRENHINSANRKKQAKYFERMAHYPQPIKNGRMLSSDVRNGNLIESQASNACYDFFLECLIPSATDYHNKLVQSPRTIIEILEKIRLP
ncbi:unnamed protein product [Auanema sp. JU1783]|nr:unnamed protein product [Auanema sp. JU1783]